MTTNRGQQGTKGFRGLRGPVGPPGPVPTWNVRLTSGGGPYTLAIGDLLVVDNDAGISFPAAAGNVGKRVAAMRTGEDSPNLIGAGSDTIGGFVSPQLVPLRTVVEFTSDGISNWMPHTPNA